MILAVHGRGDVLPVISSKSGLLTAIYLSHLCAALTVNLPSTLSIHQLHPTTTCHHAGIGLNGIYSYPLIIIYSIVVRCGLLWSLHNTSSTPLTQGSMSRLGKRSSSSWVSTSGSLITRRAKALSSGKDGKVKMTTMTMMRKS